ncbi:MAG: quinate 5-dehydrogenase [Anaerolineales bacterium]|uniref:Quinate 5-dehydrogenase n=1 Tax=Candidatus Desulfolinea nitratireducens TaxID=2841698 RepID=A0A8J6TH13_9CHLR|nr:quinate 5-dehydrogenase [Candidatus Desulfolinea nitratireducens]MBL6961470.1 quinate 5-dehydrogenase [Anaerolineales bacterium]
MKYALSISLGSSSRDKKVEVKFKDETVVIERIGLDGDVARAKEMYEELDGKVDAFGMGGLDLYLRLEGKEYPLRAALKLIENVKQTPVVDGRGLKHTLERRIFELAAPALGGMPKFHQAFIPLAIDRIGLATAISEITEQVIFGDLMVALGLPLPVYGLKNFKRVAKIMLPFVSYFPMSLLFYGSDGAEQEPKYEKYWEACDLIAGDFLFMRKYMPQNISGKTIITNTTTDENVALCKERGVQKVITSTPRYDGRSFGTNMMEAALTAYAGLGRQLTDAELNALIDELDIRPQVQILN